jgi:hypothetical protein
MMDVKKVLKSALLVLFYLVLLLAGIIIFFAMSIIFISWLLPAFIIAYAIVLGLTFRKKTKTKIIIIISLFLAYFIIEAIPFPTCDAGGFFGDQYTNCSCIGIKKMAWFGTDFVYTQCIGFPAGRRTFSRQIDWQKAEEEQILNRLSKDHPVVVSEQGIGLVNSDKGLVLGKFHNRTIDLVIKNYKTEPLRFQVNAIQSEWQKHVENQLKIEHVEEGIVDPGQYQKYSLSIEANGLPGQYYYWLNVTDLDNGNKTYGWAVVEVDVVNASISPQQ